MASLGKKTMGRKKIEMKMIEKKDDRLITFSKRRSGIYKKIAEIAILCGVDVLFICFSPAGKPFSFCHPSMESVASRIMDNSFLPARDNTHTLVEDQRKVRINQIIQQYNEVTSKLNAAKEKAKVLAQNAGEREGHFWWETPIDQLNPKELEELELRFAELLDQLYISRSKKIAATTLMPTPRDPAQFNTSTPRDFI
ncbi:hypothetical protein F3Y22_tig00116962pilonHSYRG00789 [Hibiscus syriacus]|uniref:MADS-box domain-containing protein n=1 Tax=Hibiscus syriacus TaxID=106335 RepID=A0A6A2WJN8_HIBSY|nr:agamous-like MADS-box protein AGL61 [Hibiscus syriacus]KAE8659633.1 hypothetical protein F3Y22_tig00116962pilonHSYRG00789 [Hibiscus syriacus]